ncbi:hypothetical protein RRG08_045415 [Elysia crispata]|uniref:Uncharacterized protein n=1 Tax=Elysia crispata TaxID=231223 RepID=A0AAE0XMG0_9GAST|nr:hypothetical protein RRG08_045415 [Elysia crispata]
MSGQVWPEANMNIPGFGVGVGKGGFNRSLVATICDLKLQLIIGHPWASNPFANKNLHLNLMGRMDTNRLAGEMDRASLTHARDVTPEEFRMPRRVADNKPQQKSSECPDVWLIIDHSRRVQNAQACG